jgi:hypothetical protein
MLSANQEHVQILLYPINPSKLGYELGYELDAIVALMQLIQYFTD